MATYWQGNPDALVTLAFSSDGVHFGTPQSAGRDEMGEQRKNGTTYGALLSAPGAVAVRVSTDRPLKRLTVLGLSDGVTTTAQEPTPSSTPAVESAATAEPSIVSRGGWGADPAYMTWAPQFYSTKKLIVHHTATSDNYTNRAGAEAQIRSIYYYHSVTQDWGDIGYNFLIDKFGTIYEGRYSRDYAGANPTGDDATGRGVTAAHTSGWNSGTVGVALLGTLTTHDATPAARDALTRLLAWEASRNGINPEATEAYVNPVSGATITSPNIAGHRDYAATACPGDTFYPTLPAIRRDVAAPDRGQHTRTRYHPTVPAHCSDGRPRPHPGHAHLERAGRNRRRQQLSGLAQQQRDDRLRTGGYTYRHDLHGRIPETAYHVLLPSARCRYLGQHRSLQRYGLRAHQLSRAP